MMHVVTLKELIAIVAAGLVGMSALAQDEPPPAGKFPDMVRNCRERARNVRDDCNELEATMLNYPGFVEDDLPQYKAAAEQVAQGWERAAKIWEQTQDQAEGWKASREAESHWDLLALWRVRLWEWRRRQADTAPDDRWYRDESRWIKPGVRPFMDELTRRQRAVSEAWGRLAEGTVPGADPKKLEELREAAYEAEARWEISGWRLDWARKREEIIQDKSVTSDELARLLAEWDKAQAEKVRIREADIVRDRQQRMVNDQLRQLDAQVRRAYEAARHARERAEEERRKREQEEARQRSRQEQQKGNPR